MIGNIFLVFVGFVVLFKFITSTIPLTEFVINIASGNIIAPGSNSPSTTLTLASLQISKMIDLVIPFNAPVSIDGVKTLLPLIQKKFQF